MQIIGFAGPAKSGKTTAALFVEGLLHASGMYRVQTRPFAQPLKESASMLGLNKQDNEDAYRWYCQSVGAGLRKRDPDHFVKMWQTRMKVLGALGAEESVVLVDDVRYENEIRAIKELGGDIYFINPGDRLDLAIPMYQHESERMALMLAGALQGQQTRWPIKTEQDMKGSALLRLIDNGGSIEDFQSEIRVKLLFSLQATRPD